MQPVNTDGLRVRPTALLLRSRAGVCRKNTDPLPSEVDAVLAKDSHPKAIGAVARHLAEATFWILSKQEPYREPKISTVSSTGDKREIPLSCAKLDPLIAISPETTIMPLRRRRYGSDETG